MKIKIFKDNNGNEYDAELFRNFFKNEPEPEQGINVVFVYYLCKYTDAKTQTQYPAVELALSLAANDGNIVFLYHARPNSFERECKKALPELNNNWNVVFLQIPISKVKTLKIYHNLLDRLK